MTRNEPLGHRYLVRPACFPGIDFDRSLAGRFGSEAIDLSIAGATYAVTGLSRPQAETIRQLWPAFIEPTDVASERNELAVYKVSKSTFIEHEKWVYELDFDF